MQTFTKDKCQKTTIFEYVKSVHEQKGYQCLSRALYKLRRLKGKSIIVCITDHDFVDEFVTKMKKQRAEKDDIEIIETGRTNYNSGCNLYNEFQRPVSQQKIDNFKMGKTRQLFIVGYPYWDEIKQLEGHADTAVYINRYTNPCKESLYHTIALSALETRCLLSEVIF